jgi:hypothetical protein
MLEMAADVPAYLIPGKKDITSASRRMLSVFPRQKQNVISITNPRVPLITNPYHSTRQDEDASSIASDLWADGGELKASLPMRHESSIFSQFLLSVNCIETAFVVLCRAMIQREIRIAKSLPMCGNNRLSLISERLFASRN